MRRLRYGGEAYLVSDEVGTALLHYVRALTQASKAGVVSLPALTVGGTPTEIQFVAGPSSQPLITPVEVDFAEPESDASVARLQWLTKRLGPEHPVFPSHARRTPRDLDLE